MDVHRLNLSTGALTLDTQNPGRRARLGRRTRSSRCAPRRSRRRTAGPRSASATTRSRRGRRSSRSDRTRSSSSWTSPPTASPLYLKTSVGSDTARLVAARSRDGLGEGPRLVERGGRRATSSSSRRPTSSRRSPSRRGARRGRCSIRRCRRTSTRIAKLARRRLHRRQPHGGRRRVARRVHVGPRPRVLVQVGPHREEGDAALHRAAEARRPAARRDEADRHQVARRHEPQLLPDASRRRCPRRTSRWSSSCTAVRGAATPGATARGRSGSPTAATRCSR